MDRTPHVPSFHRSNFRSLSQSAASAYASTGGHTHTRLRSPYAPSTRPTDGHTLCWRGHAGGDTPRARAEGGAHAPADTPSHVWGAVVWGVFARGALTSPALPLSRRH